ncbi:MAG: DsbA family protein [Acidobacteriia bacterium]|nr:DsbA family protein [Terriglobia bacterium]
MKTSAIAAFCGVAVLAVALAWTSARTGAAADDNEDLKKRIAALEAGQKTILKELQEIKALLQTRPPLPGPAPTTAAPGSPATVAPQQNPTAPPNFDLEVAGAPARGRADAKLVLLEFSDFQCPFCGRYTRETLQQLERDYVDTGKVRYVFRNFPLERLHPLALRSAEAAECARVQGKFWEVHTRLFANQQALAETDLVNTAQAVGLNMSTFQQCFASQLTSPTRIRQDLAEGARAGITGTPTFFMGTMTKEGRMHPLRKLVGAQPYAAFKTAIDGLLSSPELSK